MYQELFVKGKAIIKDDVCMMFYNQMAPLYIETDALGVWLGGRSSTGQGWFAVPMKQIT